MPLRFAIAAFAALTIVAASAANAAIVDEPAPENASAAYRWLDVALDATGREVLKVGARPTIISRQLAIVQTAVYDAWAAYDDKAVGTRYGGALRRPPNERTQENKETAIAYAAFRAMLDQFPSERDFITAAFEAAGFDADNQSLDPRMPAGIGNLAAKAVLDYRRHDGANQHGDEIGSHGAPYSQYIMYRPVNGPYDVKDPDRWQPIPASDGKGGVAVQEWLTPHWYRVKTFGLTGPDQFRAPPPPLVGSDQLLAETEQVAQMNADLTPEQKALVEFMRDGPASTGQSGHWLQMAQVVSRRDGNDLDTDVKLYFAVANVAFDAFIASWDSKIYYDTSRPWTLIRHYFGDEVIDAWGGPGEGKTQVAASRWHPYSPVEFPTPPFAGYPSGHSTVSAASADTLKRFTGSDDFGYVVNLSAGSLTEPGNETPVTLEFPTFTFTAEAAGISRLYGGYHIQADNIEGLKMGRLIAGHDWPVIESYFNGDATIASPAALP